MGTMTYEDLLKSVSEIDYKRLTQGQWLNEKLIRTPGMYQFYPGRGGPNLNQTNSMITQITEELMKDFSIDLNVEISKFLKELSQAKFLIKIKEIKFYKDEDQKTVICRMILNETKVLYGMAKCHPKDVFNYDIGKKVALTDAIKNLEKHHRAKIWKYYQEKGSKKGGLK